MDNSIKPVIKLCKMYEMKLQELMSEKEFDEFAQKCAQNLFMDSVDDIEDMEFKQFILDNLDDIFNLGGNDDVPID